MENLISFWHHNMVVGLGVQHITQARAQHVALESRRQGQDSVPPHVTGARKLLRVLADMQWGV